MHISTLSCMYKFVYIWLIYVHVGLHIIYYNIIISESVRHGGGTHVRELNLFELNIKIP